MRPLARASPKYVKLAERGAQVQSHQFLSGLRTVWAFRDRVGMAFWRFVTTTSS
jgi:hypothetical protein